MRMKRILIFSGITALLLACARMGSPEGGPKDTQPPEMTYAEPPDGSVNFKGNKITLHFNEFIQLDNPLNQIVFSPPLEKVPDIKPSGYADKKIEIKFKEKLRPNTTYTIYFNDAVKDYHEGNIAKNFRFVFSTGPSLDSLKLSGKITPAISYALPGDIIVALYPENSFTDSLPLTGKPYYLTKPDGKGHFTFTHLHPGTYRILAFSDKNHNLTYQPGEEQIAFAGKPVKLPGTEKPRLVMFAEPKAFSVEDLKQLSRNRWQLRFDGYPGQIRIKVPGKKILYYPFGKTFDIWIKPVKKDETLHFIILKGQDTLQKSERVASLTDTDSLRLQFKGKKLYPYDTLRLQTTVPIVRFNDEKIQCQGILKSYKKLILPSGILAFIPNPSTGNTSYSGKCLLLPGAVTDFTGHKNRDTLRAEISLYKPSETGQYALTWTEAPKGKTFIVQLTDGKGKQVFRTLRTEKNRFVFKGLKPGKYRLRIIIDENKNGRWDTGDYLEHRQPEPVVIYPKIIEIRGNWQLEEKF